MNQVPAITTQSQLVQALGLAIHTATPHLGLALGDQPERLKLEVLELGRAMSNQLQLQLMKFVAPHDWTELAFLAVARGPGGFTGTRLGMVTLRTLAQQLEIPLYSISTLAAVAQRHWTEKTVSTDQAIAIEMRAQRGQWFTALYQWKAGLAQPVIHDQVCSPAAWEHRLKTLTPDQPAPPFPAAISNPSVSLQQPIQRIAVGDDAAQAIAALWQIAFLRYSRGDRPGWQQAEPFYGQHPVTH